MDLGRGTLRRNGTNGLQNALHPEHGLLWTDGKGIHLAPVHLYRDQVENVGSTRLGEFDYVQSVHWSCSQHDECCYMAAVHQQIVTVWRVSGAVPRLAFKQVRKVNVQPVPQGCLWNPKNDVLCLLSRQQCSFYFRHAHNRGSFAFPSLEQEKISCGCWSLDGKRLVVCVGAALLIYTWTDLETNINDFVTAAWRIPGLSGSITAIEPGSSGSVVCASDLPLETLCKNNSMDAFVMPEIRITQTGSDDILKPDEGLSVKDSLLNLQHNQKPQVEDSAMLTVVQLKSGTQDPTVLTSTQVPGLLSPDLLHFQGGSQCIVVGSNTQSTVQVFALLDNRLLSAGHLTLEKDKRPKGVCSLHTDQLTSADGVLVLIGTTAENDSAFPTTNNLASFALSLRFIPIRPEKSRHLPNGHAGISKTPSSSSLTKSESLREGRSVPAKHTYRHARQASYKGERPDHRFRSPERGRSSESRIKLSLADISSGEAHSRLVEEITDSPRSVAEDATDSPRSIAEETTDSSQSIVEEIANSPRSIKEITDSPQRAGKEVTNRPWTIVEEITERPPRIVEVDGEENCDTEDKLTVEKVDFAKVSPHFHNSKLAQQYEINYESTSNRTSNSPASILKSDQTGTKETTGKAFGSVQTTSKDKRLIYKASKSGAGHMKTKDDAHTSSDSKQNSGQSAVDKKTSHSTASESRTSHPVMMDRILNLATSQSHSAQLFKSHHDLSSSSASTHRRAESPGGYTSTQKSEQSDISVGQRSSVDQHVSGSWQDTLSPRLPHTTSGKSKRQGGDDEGSVCSSIGSSYETLEKQIQAQNDQITALQKRIEEIARVVDRTACVFPSKYQEMTEPEAVSLQCVVGGAQITRKFLLDNGRLQLDSVKQAFGLSSVELILDGEPLVLGANLDGYIPMKFTPGSFLQVTGIPMMYAQQVTQKTHHKEATAT